MEDERNPLERTTVVVEELPNGRLQRVRPGFLTRAMVKARMGWNESQMRSITHSGQLTMAKRNEQGRALYLESDVTALSGLKMNESNANHANEKYLPALVEHASAYSKSDGSRVFKLIHAKTSLVDIQLETGLHPSVILSIVKDYAILTDAILVPKKVMDEINKLPLEGEMPLADAFAIYRALADGVKEHTCRQQGCTRKRTRVCAPCAKEIVLAQLAQDAKRRALATGAASGSG